ncbi:hypothetical protein [Natrinema halophilum]|uniref:hypothetical protein n=1 Tax=Natrinema halophilum TaxID=1699371 RepID=UPI001F1F9868|nr:hypothetical protein [Natrinema halophilum]UHQ96125.1 hypothetical protein HYG82_22650 [Natrinema halophilum]
MQGPQDLVQAANDDHRFESATEQFDGSITIETGSRTLWLRIYRRAIIATEPSVPMAGETFSVVGETNNWARLVCTDASLSELLYDGSLRTKGNKIERNRMRDCLELLVRHLETLEREAIQ